MTTEEIDRRTESICTKLLRLAAIEDAARRLVSYARDRGRITLTPAHLAVHEAHFAALAEALRGKEG